MTNLHNDTLIRALLRQPVKRTPVWLMRQAGRYLPEYRALRAQAGDFMTLCKTPELACEVTLQPLARFNLDAAIIFSDILTIPDAMGLGLSFVENEGPVFEQRITSQADVKKLRLVDPEIELRYVCDAVRHTVKALADKVPLIGFAGSPWTLATYMIEGGSSKTFNASKKMLYQDPYTLHLLLGLLAETVMHYLNAQIKAGAAAVMIFDTWGGILSPQDYRAFSLDYMAHIIGGLIREQAGKRIPIIMFTKQGGQYLETMIGSGCDAIGLDATADLSQARALAAQRVALQGNLDPAVLYANPERIRQEVGKVLASYGQASGHVFNLGHGVPQDVSPDHVQAMVAAVHELSPFYH